MKLFQRLGTHLWLLISWSAFILLGTLTTFRSPAVRIEWQTASETNSAGFNIYRFSESQSTATKVNSGLISSKGSSSVGASYSFIDRSIAKGTLYIYRLEEIGLDGTAVVHQAFEKTAIVPFIERWLIAPFLIILAATIIHLMPTRPQHLQDNKMLKAKAKRADS